MLLGTTVEKAQLFQKAHSASESRYHKERVNAENLVYRKRMWREKVAGQKVS